MNNKAENVLYYDKLDLDKLKEAIEKIYKERIEDRFKVFVMFPTNWDSKRIEEFKKELNSKIINKIEL